MSGCSTNLLQKYTALSPGGPMFSAWLTPPLTPLLRLHVFNITNPAAVLAGQDPVTVELGPYVYTATHIRSLSPVKLNNFTFDFKTALKRQKSGGTTQRRGFV